MNWGGGKVQECDLIMKGGITSGVVYPHAIVEIAKDYRLRNVGGTSAGAIAAVFAAAAEYRRQSRGGTDESGFAMIAALAGELGEKMQTFFQPAAPLQPLFDMLIAAVSEEARVRGKPRAVLGALKRTYRIRFYAAVAALVLCLLGAVAVESVALFLFAAMLTGITLAVSLVISAYRMVFHSLPAHDFGLCPGIRQSGRDDPGFTDWIADKIDLIAGNAGPDGRVGPPLTVGQLEAHGIGIATMTTDLATQRPYQLPLRAAIHYFRKSEFERLLPERVLDQLIAAGGAVSVDDPDAPSDLYKIPVGADFPVLLVARMSLSFPGLISAMPLYRHDNVAAELADGVYPVKRCLFSDGGISSNFPIHFFDALAPTRPTFGIALGAWDAARDGQNRIDLPTRGSGSTALAVTPVDSLPAFLSSIVNTAKDWQDKMQSLLPGYAERIVTIRLDESREGGLNLSMDEGTIATLAEFGRQAGSALRETFSYAAAGDAQAPSVTAFDQHRYNRAISLLPEIERALSAYAVAMDGRPAGAPPSTLTGMEVLTDFASGHYKNTITWRKNVFAHFAERLAQIGRDAAAAGSAARPSDVRHGTVPHVDSVIRLLATADRTPKAPRAPRQ
jgi:predicted acylesterase/phospholipase RssA